MIQFPKISRPAFPEDEVECCAEEHRQYDGPNMTQYPLRHGYEWKQGRGKYARENYVLQRREHNTQSTSQRSNQSFIQTWLFFGCLIEIFAVVGMEIQSQDFIYEKQGRRFLTLDNFDKYVMEWKSLDQDRDSDIRSRHQSLIDECLEIAEILAAENLRRQQSYRKTWSLPPECSLLIQLLHEALRHAWGSIYQCEGLATISGAGLLSDIPEERMIAADWCPSEISMLQDRFSVTGRYFASKLQRRKTPMNHNQCNTTKCFASQIDNSTYLTKHVLDKCRCGHVCIDSERVGSILRAGKIPRFLIQTLAESQDDIEVKVVDSGAYIAISHVWAHGLGNAKANSLPLCQFRRLRDYMLALGRDVRGDFYNTLAIWIDTLGVPLERETRKLALKALRGTYAESACCLILDEELYQTSSESSLEERCMRLILSSWSRRLWTFQEGLVTWDQLYIQFREGPQSFSTLRNHNHPILHSSLRSECVKEAKSSLPRVEDIRATDRDIVGALTEACKYRTTSRLSDEIFCLASVAGLDLQAIVQATTHEEKMELFLLQLREIPKRIIFFTGPKLQVDGFRWAPSSFLYPKPSSNIFGDEDDVNSKALCLPVGLQAQWPGFILHFPSAARPEMDLYYFRFGEFWVVIHCIALMEQKIHDVEPDEENILIWRQIHAIPYPGLLVNSFDSLEKMGLILSIEQEGTKAITAQPILGVSSMMVPVGEDDLFNPKELDPTRGVQITGTIVDQDTLWIIR